MTALKGMTWSHPRGHNPLVACSKLWFERTGVEVQWEKRSLQDFESYPVQDLARRYDLIVIDHPHVGQITREGCLVPLDQPARKAQLATLARQSVGPSFASYRLGGHQWALPIDVATQIQAWRRDRMPRPLTRWDEALELARSGRIALPMRPPHSLMCFFTLAANLGHPCAVTGPGPLIEVRHGISAFDLLRSLVSSLDPGCFEMDPIAVYEDMSQPGSRTDCVPLIYGYANYGLEGFRAVRLAFADFPAAGPSGPVGSALGGTGIAVSAESSDVDAAVEFAFWIAGAEVQNGLYPAAGGQPGNAVAWEDDAVNARTGAFYRDTRATLDGAWVRPRHDGYMAFQDAAAARINDGLRRDEDAERVVGDLNRLFAASFR